MKSGRQDVTATDKRFAFYVNLCYNRKYIRGYNESKNCINCNSSLII